MKIKYKKKIDIIKRSLSLTSMIPLLIKREVQISSLEKHTRDSGDSLVSDIDEGFCVSLTTYGERIYNVHLAIESIGLQTHKASKIILWLDKEEFNNDTLPVNIKKQISRGLEVKYCEDIKSYKKLIPTLKKYPEYNVITIDDDFIYPSDMIERLIKEHFKYPSSIIGNRAHLIKNDTKGDILPYLDWEIETHEVSAGSRLFLTTGGGTFFPKNCFSIEASNCELFTKLSPTADDVWVNIMAAYSNVVCRRVPRFGHFNDDFIPLDNSDLPSLSNVNVDGNMNNHQLTQCIKYFGLEEKYYG